MRMCWMYTDKNTCAQEPPCYEQHMTALPRASSAALLWAKVPFHNGRIACQSYHVVFLVALGERTFEVTLGFPLQPRARYRALL